MDAKFDEKISSIYEKLLETCITKEDVWSIASVIKNIATDDTVEIFLGRVLWLAAENPPRLRFISAYLRDSKVVRGGPNSIYLDVEQRWDVYVSDGTPAELISEPATHSSYLNTHGSLDQVVELQTKKNPFTDETYLECEDMIFEFYGPIPAPEKKPTPEDYGYVVY